MGKQSLPPAQSSRSQRSSKKTASPRRRAAPDDAVITIRAHDGKELLEKHVTRDVPIERLAQEWTYILRARSRWADDAGLRQHFRDLALEDLARIGISSGFVQQLASLRHVEIELHKWDSADTVATRIHEAASDVPWEYLLSAGTRGEGRSKSILITRLFQNDSPATIPPPPQHVLFVESNPGRLNEYDFDSERARIGAAVGAGEMTSLTTPQIFELKKCVWDKPWEVIHVSGVDPHHAAWLIEGLYDGKDGLAENPAIWSDIVDASGRVRDGMVLREGNVAERPVNYEKLASILVNPKHPPSVVTLNLYYSGARTARELVGRGAHAAIGFLDEIDDEMAELFFQAFYWAWCRPNGCIAIPHAFVEAWQKTGGGRLHGTAIVIWMGRSVFEHFQLAPRKAAQASARKIGRLATRIPHDERPVRELLQVECEVDDEVNYSLLHNDRELLSKLTLTKLVEESLEDIAVHVELNVGAQNYPYRYTHLVLDEPQRALASVVKIPLTASLPRSLRERVRSTVYIKVTCGGRTAYEDTKRITLIPVDEWLDDTRYNPWLPSFVLPRDPAILNIINTSRRYLIGIKDNPAAGFDGYQSTGEDKKNPHLGVDAQVRAIWTALVNEHRLQYINPPPAYSKRTQRLRTPSDILSSNTGTCIDLALLLASCLEYVDIYPVIVLLTGHAFVGYWRSGDAHQDLVEVVNIPADVPAVGSRLVRKAAVPLVDPYGWRLTRMNYNEVMSFVTAGHLVMLETTYLTAARSFDEAVKEGRANMRSLKEFDSLIDIRLARSATPPVTPLPIIKE